MSESGAEDVDVAAGVPMDGDLARVLVSLADTLVADYDVVEMLDALVHGCVDLLGVSQAGLVLGDRRGDLHLMASSNEATRVVELFQLQGAEGGPCVEAWRTGSTIDVEDLRGVSRWPRFSAKALEVGFSSVHAVPMRWRDHTIGALNLFGAGPPSLSPSDRRLARALADLATVGILQQTSLQRSTALAEQLRTALSTRVVIEQAKGVLAEFGDVEMDLAFDLLRTYARSHGVKLGTVATRLVQRELDPGDVVTSGGHTPREQ